MNLQKIEEIKNIGLSKDVIIPTNDIFCHFILYAINTKDLKMVMRICDIIQEHDFCFQVYSEQLFSKKSYHIVEYYL